eukprot:3237098-Prymnesium_polylepis.1
MCPRSTSTATTLHSCLQRPGHGALPRHGGVHGPSRSDPRPWHPHLGPPRLSVAQGHDGPHERRGGRRDHRDGAWLGRRNAKSPGKSLAVAGDP